MMLDGWRPFGLVSDLIADAQLHVWASLAPVGHPRARARHKRRRNFSWKGWLGLWMPDSGDYQATSHQESHVQYKLVCQRQCKAPK